MTGPLPKTAFMSFTWKRLEWTGKRGITRKPASWPGTGKDQLAGIGNGGHAHFHPGDFKQGLRTGFQGGTGGDHIIDQQDVPVPDLFGIPDGKDIFYIFPAVVARFAGLRL
ncbi:MAG: hypothetical protein MZV49_05035 [Rhodopseudomonas palustris]|nr:hypothetical protein [Rhodopseudomonas palustris]